jgi:uncharacterized protein YkwD
MLYSDITMVSPITSSTPTRVSWEDEQRASFISNDVQNLKRTAVEQHNINKNCNNYNSYNHQADNNNNCIINMLYSEYDTNGTGTDKHDTATKYMQPCNRRHRVIHKIHEHEFDDDASAPLSPRSDKYQFLNSPSRSSSSISPTISGSFDSSSSSSNNNNSNTSTWNFNNNNHHQVTPPSLPYHSSIRTEIKTTNSSNISPRSSTTTTSISTEAKTNITNDSCHSPKHSTAHSPKHSVTHTPKQRSKESRNTCILDVWSNAMKKNCSLHNNDTAATIDNLDTDIDRTVFDLALLINKERQYYKLHPLQRSSELDYLAREHCQLMANSNQLHHSVTTKNELQIKLSSCLVGENIQRGTSICDVYRKMMMNNNEYNDTNRQNVLSKQFTEFGSAIYIGTNDCKMYCCQFFRKIDY